MSSELAVGQKVICVDDLPRGACCRTDEAIPTKGSVYTIREILRWKDQKPQWRVADEDGLLLVEIVNPERCYSTPVGPITCELAFRVSRFRPAPEIGVFHRILERAELVS